MTLSLPDVGWTVNGTYCFSTSLGCCGTASLGLCPLSAPGLHDPWKLTPFFIASIFHASSPKASWIHTLCPYSGAHFSLLDCWWELLPSKLLLCSPNSESTAVPVPWSSSAHLPSWHSIEIALLWQSVGIVGEREVCKRWLWKREMGELWGR